MLNLKCMELIRLYSKSWMGFNFIQFRSNISFKTQDFTHWQITYFKYCCSRPRLVGGKKSLSRPRFEPRKAGQAARSEFSLVVDSLTYFGDNN